VTITADPQPTFGSGGAEPYARALRREGRLQLVRAPGTARQGDRPTEVDLAAQDARDAVEAPDAFDVARWSRGADAADLSTILEASSVLDIGCGPARMVRAAVDRGLGALGVDVSVTAVAMAVDAGLPVVAGSVFDALPGEGTWDRGRRDRLGPGRRRGVRRPCRRRAGQRERDVPLGRGRT
jgi:hypothetical protein